MHKQRIAFKFSRSIVSAVRPPQLPRGILNYAPEKEGREGGREGGVLFTPVASASPTSDEEFREKNEKTCAACLLSALQMLLECTFIKGWGGGGVAYGGAVLLSDTQLAL